MAGQLGLKPVQEKPFNAEAPLEALATIPTPTPLFYVRSNFDVPQLALADWHLRICGAVAHERTFTFDDLAQFESTEALVLLECAGNGRKRMVPVPSGVAWDLGAVSCANFRGIPLGSVLAECGVSANAVEALFVGADSGEVQPGRVVTFERSVPIAVAQQNTMLATQMNGRELTPAHGYPLRALVPRWYAVASVKWLVEIRILEQPFVGHFQTERYVYIDDPLVANETPVREMRVRALIADPADGSTIPPGATQIRGIAWAGMNAVAGVDISIDNGLTWQPTELTPAAGPAAPALWSYHWHAQPGTYSVLARATDAAGNTQPMHPIYNRLGYGNNVVQRITIRVENRDGKP